MSHLQSGNIWPISADCCCCHYQVSDGRSVRALYGLIAVANQLPDKDAGPAGSAAQELPKAAAEALVKMYAEEAPEKLPIVKQALARYL